ncbi:hypothetical protein [Leifsonia sp. 2MCAF36]|uniref:hypothetical protein n=1 Tax=Leifsonia sp. 2MCAF36 TaxID=3232988 RepID=UPI003F95CE67
MEATIVPIVRVPSADAADDAPDDEAAGVQPVSASAAIAAAAIAVTIRFLKLNIDVSSGAVRSTVGPTFR